MIRANLNDILHILLCTKPLRTRGRVSRIPTMPPAPRIRRRYGKTTFNSAGMDAGRSRTIPKGNSDKFRACPSCNGNVTDPPVSPSQSNCSEAMLSTEVGRVWRKSRRWRVGGSRRQSDHLSCVPTPESRISRTTAFAISVKFGCVASCGAARPRMISP